MKVLEGKVQNAGCRFLLLAVLMSVTASCNSVVPHGAAMPTYRMPSAVVVQTSPVTLSSGMGMATTASRVPQQVVVQAPQQMVAQVPKQMVVRAPVIGARPPAPVVSAISSVPVGSAVIRQAPITVHRPAVMVSQPPVWVGSPPVPIGRPPVMVRQPPIVYHQAGIVLHPPKVEFQNPTFVPPVYNQPPPQAQLVPPATSTDPEEPAVTRFPVPVTPSLEPAQELPPK